MLLSSNRYGQTGFVTLYYIHVMTEAQPGLKCHDPLDMEHGKQKRRMNTKCWLENLLQTTFRQQIVTCTTYKAYISTVHTSAPIATTCVKFRPQI
jgi:hypothetical protein